MPETQATEEEDHRTKGAQRFDAFMLGKNPTGSPIIERIAAAALGVTEPSIRAWRNGRYIPDWGSRRIIEAWTGGMVKAEWWCDDAEVERFRQAEKIKPYGTDTTKSRKGKR